ncbi:zinc finger MYM-type protein 2 isoform X1 [Hoplias malabaricus]|uniref:zinc finger MYM-type protein 2 isoform X1 n=1 Tax=Hoplias malabaricus TaxID=27720 RepID=UPI003462C5C5
MADEEQSSGAEMARTVADLPMESSSSSDRPQQGQEDDELDGFPVLGAEEEDWDSSSSQKERNSEEQEESENQNGKPSQSGNADENAQESPMEESNSHNEASTSTREPGGSVREENVYSPLMKIKDEPIDEGYDKALNPPSDVSRVKEELENGEHELAPPPDELRISSVFSVRGASDSISASVAAPQPPSFSLTQSTSAIKAPLMVLPTQQNPHLQARPLTQIQLHLQPHFQPQPQHQPQHQPQPQLQLQPQLQPQPQPPAASIRICCSGCSKVLQKGQTAFQRKGSNQLFCSTVCLTGFNLPPPISIAPKKTCHLCLKVIGNPKDLITVPGDSSNLLEFCSQACLTIYKTRTEGYNEEEIERCTLCRAPKEIQHEVNHQGVVHRLCSDECFLRFRSTKKLSMSCCESCGTCTVTGNYHLVQLENKIKKFCSPMCINNFKQKSNKKVHCPYCNQFKCVDQMLEGTNTQGVIEFFCSTKCVTNCQASRTLSGASFPCTNCQKLAIPQYHLAMPDGSIRNFCSYECVSRFQEKLQSQPAQMNGSNTVAPNPTQNTALRGPLFNTSTHPSAPPQSLNTSTQIPQTLVPTSNQNHINQLNSSSSAPGSVKLTCKQCQRQFSSKPDLLQFKNHVGLFCTRVCCDIYKREKGIKTLCEYCKEEKVLKDISMYEHKPRAFCTEGCKLLFKHDLMKQHGKQCSTCAYCCNMTHSTIQNHFGGKLEEFCTEECMSLYTVLFYEMAKCYWCKTQGVLNESLKWDGMIKHFCNLHCVLQFCSKIVARDQPISNGITTAAAASISKDMPVIGGVVSLASALAGNTALTGALPTSNASSKIIGDASTQTDAAMSASPHQRRMLKNKALMCKPIIEEQGIQCGLESPKQLFETVIDENGEKVKLVPFPVPIPMPVYIPVPMHLYTQFTPVPLGITLPVPVPLVVSAPSDSAEKQPSASKTPEVPSQSSVEDEEAEKSKDPPVSHGDLDSTYSGDLESEARSTPFSWADNEDSSYHKPLIPSSKTEGPPQAHTTATSPIPLDLEKDFPIASNDHESSKEQKSPKRRKRGKRAMMENLEEDLDKNPDFTDSFSDTISEQLNMENCELDENKLYNNLSSTLEFLSTDDEQVEQPVTDESDAPLNPNPSGSASNQILFSEAKYCFYCRIPSPNMAMHLVKTHAMEKDVAHALSFPKTSRKRKLLLKDLCKKGNYQHNIEVLRKGQGQIVAENLSKGKKSIMEYLPCQYCLAFYLRNDLIKHESSCQMKVSSESFLNELRKNAICSGQQSFADTTSQPTLELLARSSGSSPDPCPLHGLHSSSGLFYETISEPSFGSSSMQLGQLHFDVKHESHCKIEEMDSEGEQCELSDEDDEREDEMNLNHESDSNSESDSENECTGDSALKAQDGTIWIEQTVCSSRGRVPECNFNREMTGPTCYAKTNITSPLSSLMCLIDREMWDKIQKYTEAEGKQKNPNFKMTVDELKAFVGLLYVRGLTGGKNMKLEEYWSADYGNSVFIETLSPPKFREISRCLRFDDRNTRNARLLTDEFAMISDILNTFLKNNLACYVPGENIAVAEQLFPAKARCCYAHYMANKPNKLGIKFWVAADVETKYMLNAVPHLGKDDAGQTDLQFSENIVLRLMEPFVGHGRNVTTDSCYTSLVLANKLLENKTTIVGAINKKSREMPPCVRVKSERLSTKIVNAGKVTLTIYQARPKKKVCILSTKHQRISTDNSEKRLPETIAYYNGTKSGADVMAQMARLFSVKGSTRFWPLVVFYNILDLAAINAHILYKQCMKIKISRRKFIRQMVKELCAQQKMAKAVAYKQIILETPVLPMKRKQCQVAKCAGNKTYDICQKCKRYVCGKCAKIAPKQCFDCS